VVFVWLGGVEYREIGARSSGSSLTLFRKAIFPLDPPDRPKISTQNFLFLFRFQSHLGDLAIRKMLNWHFLTPLDLDPPMTDEAFAQVCRIDVRFQSKSSGLFLFSEAKRLIWSSGIS